MDNQKALTQTEWIKYRKKGFHIHHINTNELDHRLSNLICIPISIHYSLHNQLRKIRSKLGLNKIDFIKYIDDGHLKFHRHFLLYYKYLIIYSTIYIGGGLLI